MTFGIAERICFPRKAMGPTGDHRSASRPQQAPPLVVTAGADQKEHCAATLNRVQTSWFVCHH
jgi:hypothetical protein